LRIIRKTHEELQEIKKKYNCKELWSWSKFNTYKTSWYEYFLKYVIKPRVPEDRCDSAYAPYGGAAHTILENYYSGKIKYEDMIKDFEDVLFTLELSGLKFDRTNEDKNKNTSAKYSIDIKHFFQNHKAITSKVDIERFLVIKVGEHIFQGYADLVKKDEDGNFIIQDWKTSSIYKGAKIDAEKGQLILYAEGLNQLGVPLNKIRICWNFLKYCNVTIQQANGKSTERQIERIKIGESLQSNAKMWLKKLGYTDDLDYYLESLLQTNSIECLPKDVQERYVFDDCYVYIPLNENVINDLNINIIETIAEIKNKEKKYHETEDDTLFWDEDVDSESYYFAVLCGYSAKVHKPYGKYLEDQKIKEQNKDNLFAGVGTDQMQEDDMSWLDNI